MTDLIKKAIATLTTASTRFGYLYTQIGVESYAFDITTASEDCEAMADQLKISLNEARLPLGSPGLTDYASIVSEIMDRYDVTCPLEMNAAREEINAACSRFANRHNYDGIC